MARGRDAAPCHPELLLIRADDHAGRCAMTPEQIRRVQISFDKIAPISATAGALFYQRLFELDPSLRPMFTGDMRAQSRKLMAMIELVVANLSEFEALLPQVQALGRDHVGYGVRDAHYDTVGAALLWTLRTGLEEQFAAEDEEAWAAAYTLLADAMKAAPQEVEPVQA
jgi:hemoglobin-like flavoprotein